MPSDDSLLARWTAISLTAFATIWAAAPPHRPHFMCCFCDTKADVAKMTVRDYAYKAYPEWAAEHPGECPRTVADLAPWLDKHDDRDPWGNRYLAVCAPRGLRVVISAGMDGTFGTADDIRSDQ